MKRYVCWLAVLGVCALPDWASAFHRCRPLPPRCRPYDPLVYHRPVVFVAPAVPVCETPLPPPRVYVSPMVVAPPVVAPVVVGPVVPTPRPAAGPSKFDKTTTTTPPAVEPLGSPRPFATPSAAPPTRPSSDDPVRPAGGVPPVPPAGSSGETLPVVPPVPTNPGISVPPPPGLTLPDPKSPPAKFPPLELPDGPGVGDPKDSKRSGPAAPSAVPTPAPGATPAVPPLPDSGSVIPSPMPAGPPDPKKPPGKNDSLPPLVLPPESSTPPTDRTSWSSPLSAAAKAAVKVEVFTAAGNGPTAGATRKVGFFNHTHRDLDLVIDGKAVKLPGRTYVHAQVPPTFRWKHGDNPPATATVPAGAAGLDVVFRE
jgi:hypothetical protein